MTVDPTRWVRRAATLAVLLVAAVAVPAAPASAHAVLLRATPAAGSVVPEPPAEVVLTFSEAVRAVPGKIRVIAPDGKRADQGEPVVSGAVVKIPVNPGGSRGTYLVSYRVISADSHPVAGGFTYSVGAPSASPPTLDEPTGVDPVVKTAIGVTRYVGYAGLLLVVGPILVLLMLWPRRLSPRGPARLVWAGLGLVAASTVAGMLLQAPYTTGGGLTDITGAGLEQVLGSQFGAVHLVRLGIVVAVALLVRTVIKGTDGTADRVLLAILGVAGLATWPLAGHPGASPVPAVSVVVDSVHLASMAVWLGGLVMLVAFLLRQADDRELGAILPIWSRWAAAAVAALLLAGIVQALIEVGTPEALVSTTYGRLILVKVGLFAVVIAVAAYSRRLVQRRVAAEQPHRIRRAVWAELGVTAVVLAISAALVQTTPARTAAATDEQPGSTLYATTLTSSLYSLQVQIDPAKVGNNSVHLYAYTPDGTGQPVMVAEWRATAALPAAGIEPIDIPLLRITDNHAIGEVSLPTAGQWQVRFTLRTSEIDQATVTATVPIT